MALSSKANIYLAGPIAQCSDEEAMSWREKAKQALVGHYDILDPMRRDYRGQSEAPAEEIVTEDLKDITHSDVLLANAWKPSVGTSMEIWIASQQPNTKVVVIAPERCSPWHRYCADEVVSSLQDAYKILI